MLGLIKWGVKQSISSSRSPAKCGIVENNFGFSRAQLTDKVGKFIDVRHQIFSKFYIPKVIG